MRLIRRFLGTLLWLSFVSTSSAQDRKAANPAAVPPNLLVLVHQEIQSGKTNERQKLVAAVSRACDRLDAPSFWIDLQSLTGNRETLTFDLFDSYEHLQEANSGWRQFYAAHSDLAQTQGQIDSLVSRFVEMKSGARCPIAALEAGLSSIADGGVSPRFADSTRRLTWRTASR